MATKVTKHIGTGANIPAGTPAGDVYAAPNLFDNWISSQDLVTQDIWVEALIYQNYASADIANMEMHPLTYDTTHYCVVKPAPGKGVNELDPTGALGYGTVGVELTIQANTAPRLVIGAGVFFEGFRLRITEPATPGTTGQYGISVQRKDSIGNYPLTIPGTLRKCRILSEVTNSGNGAVSAGSFSSIGDIDDNVFFQSTGNGVFIRNISNVRVRRNTFVRSGTSTGTAISSNVTAPTYEDNVFSNCTGIPMTLTADASTNIRNNFTDIAKTNSQTGLTYAANLITGYSDVRPVAAGPLINAASVNARDTYDIRETFRGQVPDVGAVQYATPVSPTGTITSQPAPNGQKQRFVGTTSNASSGTYTLTGSNGGVTVGPSPFTVVNDAFDFTPSGLVPGTYTPTLTVTGSSGVPANVTGTSAFSIMGVDGQGDVPAPAAPSATVPAAPTNVVATAGDGTVTLNATVPDDGGSPITSYYASASTGQNFTNASLPMTFAMPNGVAASFQVRAVNAVGSGPFSAASNSVTPQANVSPPGAPSVTATAGNNSISVTVTAPVSNGGSAIIDYTVTLSTGETLTQASGPFVFNGLSAIARTATATARNSAGTGPVSAASNSVTPTIALSVPSAPLNPVATAGPQSITVTYQAPVDNGGSPVLEYLGTLSTGETASSTTLTMTFASISANVARTATIRARNNQGTGPASVASNSATPSDPVPVVTGVSVIPSVTTLTGESSIQLTAVVQGLYSPSQSVIWSCNGGTVDANGIYTAPAASIIPQEYVVTATSVEDPSFSAVCAVTILKVDDGVGAEGAPMRHYVTNITNKFGVALEGAFVTVTNNDTGEKATLWKDREKVEELHNPLVTDDEGLVDFYVEAAQCSYHVKGPGITPYTREDIFDIIQNVDLTPINQALTALQNTKISTYDLQQATAPLAAKSQVAALQLEINEVKDALPNLGSAPTVSVNNFVTGGDGTENNPWTGWDTGVQWVGATQYDFQDGYYSYTESPNFAKNFLRLNTRRNTVFIHNGAGVALNLDAGSDVTTIVVGLDIRVRVRSNASASGGMLMRGVAQSKVVVDFNDTPNVCVQEISCVLNECEYSTSPTQRGRTFAPVSLLTTGRRGSGIGCAGNRYKLLAENCTGTGIVLDHCTNSNFVGASQYNDIGISATATSTRNVFEGFVLSRNKTEDINYAGEDSMFSNLYATGQVTFSGKGNRLVGGTYDTIIANGKNSHLSQLIYATNGGRLVIGGQNITRFGLYNVALGTFDSDQYHAMEDLTVRGVSEFSSDTFNIGQGQFLKNPDGQVLVGTAISNGAARMQLFNPKNTTSDLNFRSTMMDNAYTSTAYHLVCQTGGSDVLRVNGVGNVVNANNSYGAISDVNLKTNIQNATPKLADLMDVRVVNYELIDSPSREKLLGVIAQELESIFPGMVEVSVGDDGVTYKTVKYSVFIPIIIKALQELNAKVDNL